MCNFKEVKLYVDEINVIIVNIAYANCKICEKQRGLLLKGLFTCAILRLQCCMLRLQLSL